MKLVCEKQESEWFIATFANHNDFTYSDQEHFNLRGNTYSRREGDAWEESKGLHGEIMSAWGPACFDSFDRKIQVTHCEENIHVKEEQVGLQMDLALPIWDLGLQHKLMRCSRLIFGSHSLDPFWPNREPEWSTAWTEPNSFYHAWLIFWSCSCKVWGQIQEWKG